MYGLIVATLVLHAKVHALGRMDPMNTYNQTKAVELAALCFPYETVATSGRGVSRALGLAKNLCLSLESSLADWRCNRPEP